MVRDLPAVGETWARALGWGECHGQRSRGALCAGVSVAVMVDLGDGVLSILSSGLHTAPSVQAPAPLRAHFCVNHNHHLCSQCLSRLLPCHSLALNSAHDLSHILVSYFVD